MGKINITFDGNNLLHSVYSIVAGFKKKKSKKATSDEVEVMLPTAADRGEFVRNLGTQFCYALNNLPSGGRVVFCIDSFSSWRKTIDSEYKANRKDKKVKYDWTNFHKCKNDFCDILRSHGIIVSESDSAEADDLLYKWSEYFIGIGESNVIISADGDITQLARGMSEPFVVVWNNKSTDGKIFCEEGWDSEWLHGVENSLFNFWNQERESIKELIKNVNIKIVPVKQHEVIFKKMLCGDDGDNVPAVWTVKKPTPKNPDGTMRFTPSKYEKLLDNIKSKYPNPFWCYWNEVEYKSYVAGVILRLMGDVDGTTERSRVIESLERNARLVWLTQEQYPTHLYANMDQHVKDMLVHESEGPPPGHPNKKLNHKNIVEGSLYEKKNDTGSIPKGFRPTFKLPE